MEINKMNQVPNTQPIAEEQPITETPVVDSPVTETAPENAPDNSEAISFIERFAPDSDTSTPEGISAGLLQIVKAQTPIYDKLYDLATTNPQSAATLKDWLDTGDLIKAINRNYSEEEKQALVEELEQDDYESDKKSYSDKVAETKSHAEKVQKNMEVSMTDISEFMESKKDWDEAKAEEFENFVLKHYDDAKDGLITKDNLLILEKGFKYDGDVAEKDNQIAESLEDGKAMGRNEKIVANKLSKEKEATLLPEASAGMGKAPAPPPRPKNFASSFMKDVKL